jgi:uncharacterized damage-inducible protein DinB
MSEVPLSGAEVLQWVDETSTQWFKFIAENPAILALPCDIMNVKSVAELLQHIIAVELRFAERLHGKEPSVYTDIPYGTVEEIAATHRRAAALFQELLDLPEYPWDEEVDFVTRSAGTFKASRRKLFFHAQLHGIRHYAQLATLVRQHGYKPGWQMDIMASPALR